MEEVHWTSRAEKIEKRWEKSRRRAKRIHGITCFGSHKTSHLIQKQHIAHSKKCMKMFSLGSMLREHIIIRFGENKFQHLRIYIDKF